MLCEHGKTERNDGVEKRIFFISPHDGALSFVSFLYICWEFFFSFLVKKVKWWDDQPHNKTIKQKSHQLCFSLSLSLQFFPYILALSLSLWNLFWFPLLYLGVDEMITRERERERESPTLTFLLCSSSFEGPSSHLLPIFHSTICRAQEKVLRSWWFFFLYFFFLL